MLERIIAQYKLIHNRLSVEEKREWLDKLTEPLVEMEMDTGRLENWQKAEVLYWIFEDKLYKAAEYRSFRQYVSDTFEKSYALAVSLKNSYAFRVKFNVHPDTPLWVYVPGLSFRKIDLIHQVATRDTVEYLMDMATRLSEKQVQEVKNLIQLGQKAQEAVRQAEINSTAHVYKEGWSAWSEVKRISLVLLEDPADVKITVVREPNGKVVTIKIESW